MPQDLQQLRDTSADIAGVRPGRGRLDAFPFWLHREQAVEQQVIFGPGVDLGTTLRGNDGTARRITVNPETGFIFTDADDASHIVVLGRLAPGYDTHSSALYDDAMAAINLKPGTMGELTVADLARARTNTMAAWNINP